MHCPLEEKFKKKSVGIFHNLFLTTSKGNHWEYGDFMGLKYKKWEGQLLLVRVCFCVLKDDRAKVVQDSVRESKCNEVCCFGE